MPTRSPRRSIFMSLAIVALLMASLAPVAAADPPAGWTATQVRPSGTITGFKSVSGNLAKSDDGLVARTDAGRVNVMIKFDYDAVASYAGGVEGLQATSPRVTGKSLSGASTAEKRYGNYVSQREGSLIKSLKAKVPGIRIGRSYRTVYGGISATIPARAAKAILAIKGVVAVQADQLQKLLTDSSPSFIDATPLYPKLGGKRNAGAKVIYGSLDSGVWPEHPSLADQGNLSAPPAKADGTTRTCDFGDNPLTSVADPFVCNNKLIGGAAFLDAYLSDADLAAAEPYHTARDSNGHGTHTSTTSAGNKVTTARVLGVNRGPLNGVAPGAWVSVYKVCGIQGCFSSDSAAAIQQAVLDGVNVINFSISGGTDPYSDPVELAFLDAYAAGVFVAASAGNEGPGAGTANHLSPWVTSVAASTQRREFSSTLTLSVAGGASATFRGASITAGAGPLPIVFASAAPYSHNLCDVPAAPGTFTGKIVACQRGGGFARVDKGYNVKQGGAAGMVLFNPTLADVETDNHWLPTVHLADGTAFKAFLLAHPTALASFTAGTPRNGQGDVMAAFSSRGPAGLFIKPDVTAPGVQILAGHTPIPESTTEGPPGQYYQAIAGTSMSSPHVAGAAVLLKAFHPSWTPGQIKSALMTTAATKVLKEDLTHRADPFDLGAGRIDVDDAAAAPLSFDETATRFAMLGSDPLTAINLNIPSINAPVMPGRVETVRIAKNLTRKTTTFVVSISSPVGSRITVSPSRFTLRAGKSIRLKVVISSDAPLGTQQFGRIRIRAINGATVHLPVAFVHAQGTVSLSQSCTPSTIALRATTRCDVAATNQSFDAQTVSLQTKVNDRLKIVRASGATLGNGVARLTYARLAGARPGVPSVASGAGPAGYLPLDAFGITPEPLGDETILNFDVPAFKYNGVTYTSIGADSNGYLVAGGAGSEDNNCCNLPTGPSPAAPNNMLAPFWTDLDGTGAPGLFAGILDDGTNAWVVVEYRVNVFGTTSQRVFQVWIGLNGVQDLSYAYDPTNLPADPNGQPFLVGAENQVGQGDMSPTLPTTDLVVTSSNPTPGASATYSLTIQGRAIGSGLVVTSLKASGVLGTTIVKNRVTVTRP